MAATALAICADRHDGVWAILGVHPHAAGGDDPGASTSSRELLAHPRAVAVGETGLDYYRDYAPHDRQLTALPARARARGGAGKPLVIHTRAADARRSRVLAGFGGDVVLHCFSSPRLLEPALERGYYVSFAGNVTYPNASELRVAARAGAGRPDPRRDRHARTSRRSRAAGGRTSRPTSSHTVAALAEARGEEPDELAAQIDANAALAFGLP